jgi:hypothetical protein
MRFRRAFVVFLIVLFCSVNFFSCKDAVPNILDVQFKTVFDFSSYEEPPETYALLFVQPGTDIEFASEIVLRHIQSGYEWRIIEPVVLREGNTVWAGSAHLVNPALDGKNAAFPQGNFLLRYIDTSERESETVLNLVYPAALDAVLADSAAELMPSASVRQFALYDGEERILYFGEKKQNWSNLSAIQREFPVAAYSRECITTPGYSAVVMLPVLQGIAE